MSDGTGDKPKRPRPVTDGLSSAGKESGSGADEEQSDARRRRSKPTPVRAMARAEAPPSPTESDVDEVELSVDETDWVVRVMGRSGGTSVSPTPLLLLGFWRADDAEGDQAREALVVGRLLSDLTPAALRSAFEQSGTPRDPPAESGTRRRKGGGRGSGRGGRHR